MTALFATLLVLHLDFNTIQMRREAVVDSLRVAAAAGYNAVLWEVEDKVRWSTCPECVHPEAFSKEEFRGILSEAERLGLEPIPLLQTFGHGEYVLRHGKYASWREDPACRTCYCVSHPEVKAFLKAFLREYLELFGPRVRRFHLGGDEALVFGTCPTCRRTDKMSLYVRHLEEVSEELRSKGIRPGVWADMVLMGGDWGKRKAGVSVTEETAKLPRHYTLWNWDYNYGTGAKARSAEMTGRLCDLGYEVVLSGAAQSAIDGPFLPRYRFHRDNLAACADLVRARHLAGLCVTSWSVHLYPKSLQYPLWEFAARRLSGNAPEAGPDFDALVAKRWGAVPFDALDRLSRRDERCRPFDTRILDYEKSALVAEPGALQSRLKNLERGGRRQALKTALAKDLAEMSAALGELRARANGSADARNLLTGAELEIGFLARLAAVLDGRVPEPAPKAKTAAYYGVHQPPQSAGRAVDLVWAILEQAR